MATEIGRINVGNAGYGNNQLYVTYDLLGQSIANNTSTVRVYLYFYAPVWISFSSASAYLHNSGWFSIATSYSAGTYHLKTVDFTVYHSATGQGSFSVGYGINTSYLVSGSGTTSTVMLKTIPRASDVTAFDNFDIEGDIKVTINKKYAGFTDKLELSLNSTVIRTIENYTSNTVINLTEDEKDIVFELMSTVNSADFTAKTTTYNGNSSIGTSNKNGKGTIYNANPLFSVASWLTTNHLDLANNQTIINGYSNIAVTLTEAIAQKKATITSYKVVCGNVVSQANVLSHSLANVNDSIIKCYAIDSRGNTTELLLNVDNYVQYTPVTLDILSADRKTNESGNDVALTFGGNLWVGNFGILENTIQAQYFYKELNSSSDWIQGSSIINPEVNDKYQLTVDIKGDLGALGFDKGKTYEIKVIVSDKLSNKERTTELTKFRGLIYYHKNGVAIGGEYDNSITDTDGNPFPLQIWNNKYNMCVPVGVMVLEDATPFLINGTQTTLAEEKTKRSVN